MTGAASASPEPRRILHVGCGGDPLPAWLPGAETRLDVDPAAKPDIVASMTALGDIGIFDVVYCCHALEHLYPHEVGTALREFLRVLSPGGSVILFVPDLEDVRPTDDILYVSPAGPIAGLDLFYGFRPLLAEMPHMAHHTGFVSATLRDALQAAGFTRVATQRLPDCFNLMGVGVKP